MITYNPYNWEIRRPSKSRLEELKDERRRLCEELREYVLTYTQTYDLLNERAISLCIKKINEVQTEIEEVYETQIMAVCI